MLPFAADFRWLILAFHKLFSVFPAEKPERARIAMKRLVSRRGWRYFTNSFNRALPQLRFHLFVITVHVPVTGSYSSLLERTGGFLPMTPLPYPPSTNTFPLGSKVAV